MNEKTDDAVGYGRPPKHSQFRKGQSGNPKGRPKKRKTLPDLLDHELEQKIEVKGKLLTKEELMAKVLVQNAIKGQPAAMKVLFEHLRSREGQNDLQDFDPQLEDHLALERWVQKLKRRSTEDDHGQL
jgi:hypothetical protein